MIRINLLPHREQARKDRRSQFFATLGLVVLLGGVILFFGYVLLEQQIDHQDASNEFLKTQIANLDKDIAEIARLKDQTQSLLSRKQVIESLQSNRAQTVTMFNELVRQMPEGVYLKSVKQNGDTVTLIGNAQSNARVSQLMRNLDASPIFEKPNLIEIKAIQLNRRAVGEYNLTVSLEKPPVNAPAAASSAPAASTPAGGKQ